MNITKYVESALILEGVDDEYLTNMKRYIKNRKRHGSSRSVMNLYWLTQLANHSGLEKHCSSLIADGSDEEWVAIFNKGILPLVRQHNMLSVDNSN